MGALGLQYRLDSQQMRKMCGNTNCLFVCGSIVLTAALLVVGISFFGPYWLSNLPAEGDKSNDVASNGNDTAETTAPKTSKYPNRGLWAQCGAECLWFWEDDYQLQKDTLTPSKWHLATQILYFIAVVLLVTSEIFARVQLCCDERTSVYWSLSILVLFSAIVQTAAIATFGGAASRDPYNAIADPTKTTKLLGEPFDPSVSPYFGWCFWVAVVGDILTVIAGSMFIGTACWVHRKY